MIKLELCIEYLILEQDKDCLIFTVIGTWDRIIPSWVQYSNNNNLNERETLQHRCLGASLGTVSDKVILFFNNQQIKSKK